MKTINKTMGAIKGYEFAEVVDKGYFWVVDCDDCDYCGTTYFFNNEKEARDFAEKKHAHVC
jgi:hypothetical protein